MAGETELHKTLKKEACRWLFRMGYRCIAAEGYGTLTLADLP